MTFGTKEKIGVAVVAAIALGGFAYWVLGFKPMVPRDILHQQGYLEIVPPSNLSGPGTINTVELMGRGKLSLHPTCEVNPSLLSKGKIESRTVESSLKQRLAKRFDISSKIKDLLSSSASRAAVKNTQISFQHVSILTMSDEALLRLQQELIKGPCQQAIVWNIRNGGIVCQTEAVIEADVIYDIVYNEKLNVDEEAKISKDLAQKLGLGAGSQGAHRIEGRGLFYGVKLQPNGIILNTPDAEPRDCRVAMLPPPEDRDAA